MMQTCEAPDFWVLHKNKNCAFLLIKKLAMYGIKGINLAWFRSCLTNRVQYISINHDLVANTNNICCEVPQGLILGPLLVLLYVNDLHNSSALDLVMLQKTQIFFMSIRTLKLCSL